MNEDVKKLIDEISTFVYRIGIILDIKDFSDNSEIKLNLLKAKDHLNCVIDLTAA